MYHVTTSLHELKEYDNCKLLQYCHWFKHFLAANGNNILDISLFSTEAWFPSPEDVNSQSSQMWSMHNQHHIIETPLHGPIFFEDSMNSEYYCELVLYTIVVTSVVQWLVCLQVDPKVAGLSPAKAINF
jgi:hypothetical protein